MLDGSAATAVVPTHDLATSRPFYEDTLGLTVAEEQEAMGSVLFDAGRGTRVLLYRTQVAIPAEHTICTFEVDDVDAVVTELESRGVAFEEYDLADFGFPDAGRGKVIAMPDGGHAAWFKDPEGNTLNLMDR